MRFQLVIQRRQFSLNFFFTQTNASLAAAMYRKESWENYITQFEYEMFQDESLKRQFKLLQTLGTAALSEEDQTDVKTNKQKEIK